MTHRLSERVSPKEELCRILVRTGALKYGVFTMPTGHLSPYYIDLRLIPSFPDMFARIVSMYSAIIEDQLQPESFDRIAAIPLSSVPYAACLSYSLHKPLVLVRKEPGNGRHRQIEGIMKSGDRVLPIDDVITTGGNLLSTVKVLRHEGAIVENALVLLDRQEGGVAKLRNEKVHVHSVVTMEDVAGILYSTGMLSQEQKDSIMLQLRRES